MRFQRLALSLSAALTVGLAPAVARAQVIVRGPCFSRWDDCPRRIDFDRVERERMRSIEREVQAEARARRLDDARWAREASERVRAETREARTFSLRLQSDFRVRERADRADLIADRARERREQAELNRRLRIRPPHIRWR